MTRSNFVSFRRCFAALLTLLIFLQNLSHARSISSNLILAHHDPEQNEDLSWFQQQVVEGLQERMSANGHALPLFEKEKIWHALQRELLGREEPLHSFQLDEVSLGLLAARKSYYQFDFVGCLHLLKQAQSLEARRPIHAPFYAPIYEQRALLEGICHLALKENQEAQRAFSEAIRLRPHETLNTLAYSPEVIRFYEETKKLVEKNVPSRRARVSLTSVPPFADVYWNAEYVGQTPLTIQHLAAGTHFVELRLNKHTSWYSQLILASGDLTRVEAQLIAQENAALSEKAPTVNVAILSLERKKGAHWLQSMVRFGEALHVNELTLVSFEPKGDSIYCCVDVVDVEKKALSKSFQEVIAFPINSQKMIEQILVQLYPQGNKLSMATILEPYEVKDLHDPSELGHDRALFERGEPIAKEVKTKNRHWAKNNWVWIALGVLLAGAAAGTAIAMSQGDDGGNAAGGFPANSIHGVVVTGNP